MKKAKEFKNTQNKNAFENFSTALKHKVQLINYMI